MGRILNMPRRAKADREWETAGMLGAVICDQYPVVMDETERKSGAFHVLVYGVRYKVTVTLEGPVDDR